MEFYTATSISHSVENPLFLDPISPRLIIQMHLSQYYRSCIALFILILKEIKEEIRKQEYKRIVR